jgi:hypothetical protein
MNITYFTFLSIFLTIYSGMIINRFSNVHISKSIIIVYETNNTFGIYFIYFSIFILTFGIYMLHLYSLKVLFPIGTKDINRLLRIFDWIATSVKG